MSREDASGAVFDGAAAPRTEDEFDDGYGDYDDDPGCTMCGGDGWVECDDPIQCTRRHFGGGAYQLCDCGACNGSGLAKDQTIW